MCRYLLRSGIAIALVPIHSAELMETLRGVSQKQLCTYCPPFGFKKALVLCMIELLKYYTRLFGFKKALILCMTEFLKHYTRLFGFKKALILCMTEFLKYLFQCAQSFLSDPQDFFLHRFPIPIINIPSEGSMKDNAKR